MDLIDFQFSVSFLTCKVGSHLFPPFYHFQVFLPKASLAGFCSSLLSLSPFPGCSHFLLEEFFVRWNPLRSEWCVVVVISPIPTPSWRQYIFLASLQAVPSFLRWLWWGGGNGRDLEHQSTLGPTRIRRQLRGSEEVQSGLWLPGWRVRNLLLVFFRGRDS